MISIIDYDAGNIKSVIKAFEYLGEKVVLTRDYKVFLESDRIVLPGVGSYGACMENLKKYQLVPVIKELAESGKPFLGICLGLQLMFSGSEEDGGVAGLEIFTGDVKKFDSSYGLKIPHIGWNSLEITENNKLYKGLADSPFVYFVHSYYVSAKDESIISSRTEYGDTFVSSIESGNVFGCQFHPEKSSHVGMGILENFCKV